MSSAMGPAAKAIGADPNVARYTFDFPVGEVVPIVMETLPDAMASSPGGGGQNCSGVVPLTSMATAAKKLSPTTRGIKPGISTVPYPLLPPHHRLHRWPKTI